MIYFKFASHLTHLKNPASPLSWRHLLTGREPSGEQVLLITLEHTNETRERPLMTFPLVAESTAE